MRSQLLQNKGNTIAIWKIINNCLPKKSKSRPIIPDNPISLANGFNEYLTSVGSSAAQEAYDLACVHNYHINPAMPTLLRTSDDCPDLFRFHPVLEKDVEGVIKGFSSNKAQGRNKITTRVLKDCLTVIVPTITSIMNNSFRSNCFPKVWKMAEVTPVLKSGNPEDPCNHRPLSLLLMLSKVSERLAQRQFVDYITTNKKLSEDQSGNRKCHSTETALLHVTDDFLMAIDKSEVSVVVLLDMAKAFDSIRHGLLRQKLQSIAVASSSLELFHNYLSGRSQRVGILSQTSSLLNTEFLRVLFWGLCYLPSM